MRSIIRMLYCRYPMSLLECEQEEVKEIESKLAIDFIQIGEANYKEVAGIRPEEQYKKEFERMLNQKAFGIAAKINDTVVGYGWAKFNGCDDKFFKVGNNVCLLASFFVRPDYRGVNIYPNIINELIKITTIKWGFTKWYIAIFNRNESSLRGAKKVGFRETRQYAFIRVLRKTIDKGLIMSS